MNSENIYFLNETDVELAIKKAKKSWELWNEEQEIKKIFNIKDNTKKTFVNGETITSNPRHHGILKNIGGF